jgi:hypothetical protein
MNASIEQKGRDQTQTQTRKTESMSDEAIRKAREALEREAKEARQKAEERARQAERGRQKEAESFTRQPPQEAPKAEESQMPKDPFERQPFIGEEALEELIMGFEYTHPEKATSQTKDSTEEKANGKTAVETAIEERKRQAEAMRSNQQPHREKEKKR